MKPNASRNCKFAFSPSFKSHDSQVRLAHQIFRSHMISIRLQVIKATHYCAIFNLNFVRRESEPNPRNGPKGDFVPVCLVLTQEDEPNAPCCGGRQIRVFFKLEAGVVRFNGQIHSADRRLEEIQIRIDHAGCVWSQDKRRWRFGGRLALHRVHGWPCWLERRTDSEKSTSKKWTR